MGVLSTHKQCLKVIMEALRKSCPPYDEISLLGRALRSIDELVEKEEKYAWRDLRNNPNDLPDMGKDVLIMIRSEGDGEFPLVGKYSYGDWKFSLPDSYHVLDGIYDVIAWKEIEPFGGGKDV